MEFRILGPLEAIEGSTLLLLGPQKQRAVLAFLLLNANHAVSVERLVDELWGDEPPERAVKAIQTYVSRLRKVLPGGTLRTRPPGYVIEIQPEQLDLRLFERELAEGNRALAEGKAALASASLRRALERWRGSALAEFASEPFARSEGPRLEEIRLFALEGRIDADLALGRHADLVSDLESLVSHHPLRARFLGQLMLALYRSGRQAEALAAYREARRLLVDELGLEPSRSLQDLERAILRQDSSLDLPPTPPGREEASREEASFVGATRHEAEMTGETREALASTSTGDRLGGFVGRQQELGQLRDALDGALAGSGRLVMLSGEPGIGKTRIAMELAEYAERRGVQVLWGRCYEREGAPPYWPWVQTIRAYVDKRDPELLRSELRGQAAAAELVPELRELLPDLEPAVAPADPNEARFRLLDSLASFLKRAAQTQALMVVLDDLHAADAGSLLLLEFVARELADSHLLVIGTYRDLELARGHPLSETLAELTRERLFERVLLRGLTEAEVARFIEESIGLAPPRELARAVYRQADGNPLFMTEVVRLLLQEGGLTPERMRSHESWSMRIPEGIRQVIGRRLKRLSERCSEVLMIASVIGREFGLDQLRKLIDDISEEHLLELLEEALAAHVIEELPRTVGRYQFTHTLIQETLADELSRTRRARLHARIAQAFEELYGAEAEAHAAELAHHFAEAEVILGPEKLVYYSLLAGEAALAAHAHEQALTHFERALAAKEGRPMDDETAALLFGLGRAQLAALEPYELEPAVTSLRRAFEHYAQAGDVSRAVTVAAHPLQPSLGLGYTDFPELIAHGLNLVSPDSHEAGRLLSQHGWFSGAVEADHDAAHRAFQRALSIARKHDDAALERRTLANAAWVDVWHFRSQDGLEKGLKAIELASHAADHTEVIARRSVVWALTATGEREQVRSHTVKELAVAERLRDRWWLASASFDQARLSVYEGDWQAARQMSEISSTAQPRDPRPLAMRALLEYELGDFPQGAAHLERLYEVTRSVPPPGPTAEHVFMAGVIPLAGRIAGIDERLDLAKSSAETLLSLPRLVPAFAIVAKSALALIAVQRSDARAAEGLYSAIESQRGTACFIIPLTFDRLLGLLAVTLGRVDAALAHFEDGLAFCSRAGYRPEYAWTTSDYAEALLARGGPGDRDKAVALQDEALALARELGMRPLMERILARREILTA